jgi:hypothetical protein
MQNGILRHNNKTLFLLFEPFRPRLASKLAKNANMKERKSFYNKIIGHKLLHTVIKIKSPFFV